MAVNPARIQAFQDLDGVALAYVMHMVKMLAHQEDYPFNEVQAEKAMSELTYHGNMIRLRNLLSVLQSLLVYSSSKCWVETTEVGYIQSKFNRGISVDNHQELLLVIRWHNTVVSYAKLHVRNGLTICTG